MHALNGATTLLDAENVRSTPTSASAHEAVQNGHLRLVRVSASKQLADIFAKGLHPQPWAACIKYILGGKWEIP
jgi:hypothetical protein